MSWVKQRYRDISPMTLQVVGGDVSSSLYCAEVEGVAGGLVESFLVELYRCKLCQFTCGLKATISSHLLLRHRPTTYMGGAESGDRTEAGLQQGVSPYQLKPSEEDEDEDFLLYNMLDNISPPTCDISSEGGLQVAHTCEVTTLFEEEEEEEEQEEEASSIFPLKGSSMSCPSDSPASQEETAQSAHLMTLGLCRISAVRPPPPPLPPSSSPRTQSPTPPDNPTHLQDSGADDRAKVPPPNLLCLLCPLNLPSRRLLNIHIRSHRASGGFSCIRCSWIADSWEELEHHWRSHSTRRRKRRREREQQEKKKKKTMVACQRTFRSSTLQNAPEKPRKHGGWRSQRIGQGKRKEVELPDRQSNRPQAGSRPGTMETTKKAIRTKNRNGKETTAENGKQTGFSCSLCHRKFSSKLTLRRHLGIHKGEKPFTCPHCSYSSRLKASLLQHLRTHTGEKPYRCAECPYASIDRSSLRRHCRTHSQEKPYRCQHCDYSSIQKKSLDLHARRHHTGEVFPCQQCDYSSPDRQLLLRHIRRHHAPSQHAAFLT